jgi:hypothetical protein
MKRILKRTRWVRFWSAALVMAVLLAGCNEVFKLFQNPAEPPDSGDPVVYPAEYV